MVLIAGHFKRGKGKVVLFYYLKSVGTWFIAPRAMVSCVMVQGPNVPLLDHVTLAGVVVHSFLQKVIVPNISPKIWFLLNLFFNTA
jgi:hypothetical protein